MTHRTISKELADGTTVGISYTVSDKTACRFEGRVGGYLLGAV